MIEPLDLMTILARSLDYPNVRYKGASAASMTKARSLLKTLSYYRLKVLSEDDGSLIFPTPCQSASKAPSLEGAVANESNPITIYPL